MATEANDPDDPETVKVNLRMTEGLLEDIDAVWKDEGYNSRSEFIRAALRDAAAHPEFTRRMWQTIAASEHAQRAEGWVSSEAIRESIDEG